MSERAGHPDDLDLWLASEPDVLAHVQECVACGARREHLEAEQHAAQDALAPLAGPLPVPVEVRRRLAVALAGAAGAGEDPSAVRPAAGATDELAARRASRGPSPSRARPWVAVAAASAAVVVGAGVVLAQLGDGSDSAPTTSDQVVAGSEAGADSGADSGTDSGTDAGGDVAAEAESAPAVPPLPDDLLAAAQAVRPAPGPGLSCGTALSTELGGRVVGVVDPAGPDRDGVLVVVDVATATSAWWLPACDSPAAFALGTSPLP
jgi:hypothetical protein